MVWTKKMELDQLRKIEALINETEENSYIRMAFAGCVKLAEENIEFDFANSYPEMIEFKDRTIEIESREHDRTKKLLEDAQRIATIATAELDELRVKNGELQKLADEWAKMAENVGTLCCEEREESAIKDAEIMRLKAEIYDLRKEMGK